MSLAWVSPPGDPQSADVDEIDPREFDARVREMAQCEVEAIWDELEPRGFPTGEIIDYRTLPRPLVGIDSNYWLGRPGGL